MSLKRVSDESVFEVGLEDYNKKLHIVEMCDYYYDVFLNKSEVLELIEDLKKLYEQMED